MKFDRGKGKMYGQNLDEAMENYEKIRASLRGLFEIVNINLPEDDFFHAAAMDNLRALNNDIIDLLKQSYSPREVRMRLRELEFDERDAEIDFLL